MHTAIMHMQVVLAGLAWEAAEIIWPTNSNQIQLQMRWQQQTNARMDLSPMNALMNWVETSKENQIK